MGRTVFVRPFSFPSLSTHACGSLSSTMRKVLQFDAESTPVLSEKYWSTDRIVLA